MDNALLHEQYVATSRALQATLLPVSLPRIPALDIGAADQAAGHGLDVGGDFYDMFAVGERWRFTVGDLCGSGPRAAAVTGLARNALRILAGQGLTLAAAVGQLNALLLDDDDPSRFVTLLPGEITLLPAGGLGVALVVAGHPLPYLLTADTAPRPGGSSQPLLGVLRGRTYTIDELTVAAEEMLVSLTDGVSERRRDGRMLGEDGLDALLVRCSTLSAPAAAAAIKAAVVDYSPSRPRDDLAVLVLRPVGRVRPVDPDRADRCGR